MKEIRVLKNKRIRKIINKDKRCIGKSRWSERYLRPIKKQPWWINYNGAMQRCNSPKCPSYKNYGARGISFLLFPEDVHFMWHRDRAYAMKKPVIDRIDSNGDYEFHNCRFLEFSENARRARKGTKWVRIK